MEQQSGVRAVFRGRRAGAARDGDDDASLHECGGGDAHGRRLTATASACRGFGLGRLPAAV